MNLGPLRARRAGLLGLVERVEQALPGGPGKTLDAAVAALIAFSRANLGARLTELFSPLALCPDPQLRSIVQEVLESALAMDAALGALPLRWPPHRREADWIDFVGALGALLEHQRLLLDQEAEVLLPLLDPPQALDPSAAAGLFALTPR